MDTVVFVAVLLAAACHAGWNALLKLEVEPIVAISLISVACGLLVAPLVPFGGLPDVAAWPYIAASLALHLVYYIALAEAYRSGDLGLVYPIARGSAPLLTAMAATLFSSERLSVTAWAGITVVAAGILLLAAIGGRGVTHLHRRTVSFALVTAAAIAAYTVVDGLGARIPPSPTPYILWLFLLDGLMMLAFGLVVRGPTLIGAFRAQWRLVLAGGAMALTSYAIALWAMTVAPIALVAALRETSVLFATLIGIFILREPVLGVRLAAVALAFAGALLLRTA